MCCGRNNRKAPRIGPERNSMVTDRYGPVGSLVEDKISFPAEAFFLDTLFRMGVG